MPPTVAMIHQLDQLQSRYAELGGLLVAPETLTNPKLLREYGQEQSRLEQPVSLYRDLQRLDEELEGARSVLAESDDPELSELASDEIAELEARVERLTHDLRLAMLPPDPNDERAVIVEIRAGAGGEEAALFAAELYRMYVRFAERRRWKVDLVNLNETGIGGHKEAIFQVNGRGAYSQLKYESGVHRVQRVPTTEASGRIHTSTTTVAVLPVAEEVEVKIDPEDLVFETYRSSGHGGQSVNTTDSAVRITHRPHGHGRDLPRRAFAAKEPAEGARRIAGAFARPAAAAGGGGTRRCAPLADRQRRPQREDPDLQLSAGSRDRSPRAPDDE